MSRLRSHAEFDRRPLNRHLSWADLDAVHRRPLVEHVGEWVGAGESSAVRSVAATWRCGRAGSACRLPSVASRRRRRGARGAGRLVRAGCAIGRGRLGFGGTARCWWTSVAAAYTASRAGDAISSISCWRSCAAARSAVAVRASFSGAALVSAFRSEREVVGFPDAVLCCVASACAAASAGRYGSSPRSATASLLLGSHKSCLEVGALFVVAVRCLLGCGELRADGRLEVGEPVGDRAARRGFRPSWCAVRGGELSSLCGGGEVDAVVGEDAFEDVAGFGDVVGLGDDEDGVVVVGRG